MMKNIQCFLLQNTVLNSLKKRLTQLGTKQMNKKYYEGSLDRMF